MRKMQKKNINLYEQYAKTAGKSEKKKINKKTLYIIFGVSGFALLAGIYVVLKVQLGNVKDEYDKLYYAIYSDTADEQSSSYEKLQYENEILQMIADNHEVNQKVIDNSDKISENLSRDLISSILDCQFEGTRINLISFDGKNVYISGESQLAYQSSDFANAIKDKNIFTKIKYQGYENQGDLYGFSIIGYFSDQKELTDEEYN